MAPRNRLLAWTLAAALCGQLACGGDRVSVSSDGSGSGTGETGEETSGGTGGECELAEEGADCLGAPETVDLETAESTWLMAVDLDGDGTDELVSEGGVVVTGILRPDGPSVAQAEIPAGTAIFLVGDFDGTGAEQVVARDCAGNLIGLEGDGAGGLTVAWEALGGPSDACVAGAVGDFDGDGRDDIALLGEDAIQILRSTGEGLEALGSIPVLDGEFLAAGDVDGDGLLDLGAGTGSAATIVFGDGAGGFSEQAGVELAGSPVATPVPSLNRSGGRGIGFGFDGGSLGDPWGSLLVVSADEARALAVEGMSTEAAAAGIAAGQLEPAGSPELCGASGQSSRLHILCDDGGGYAECATLETGERLWALAVVRDGSDGACVYRRLDHPGEVTVVRYTP